MSLTNYKRQTSFLDDIPMNKKVKIEQSNNCNCLEEFPNELFYEIFGYLDSNDIYIGFNDLNQRFQNLVHICVFPLKINLSIISKSNFEKLNQQLLIPNRHQIQTLQISNPVFIDSIFSPPKIAAQFLQLETLVLNDVKPAKFRYVLHHLASLKNLLSLTIISKESLGNICKDVFSLPKLKYCKLSSSKLFINVDLFSTTKFHRSSIEHLVIESVVKLYDLIRLSPYFPSLRTLSIDCLTNYQTILPHLTNTRKFRRLKKVHFSQILMTFDEFELISRCLFNQIKSLSVSIIDMNEDYLDAQRWEQLIASSMPNLHELDLRYQSDASINETYRDNFSSPFWIEHNWIFDYEISENSICHATISTKKKMSQQQCIEHIEIDSEYAILNCNYYFLYVTQLVFSDSFYTNRADLSDVLDNIMPLQQIKSLTIDNNRFSAEQFLRLLSAMPNIRTLHSNCGNFSDAELKQSELFQLVSKMNQISNLYIRDTYELETFKFFINLCPQTRYLMLDVHTNPIVAMLRFISSSKQTCLSKLCLLHLKATSPSMLISITSCLNTSYWSHPYLEKTIGREHYIVL